MGGPVWSVGQLDAVSDYAGARVASERVVPGGRADFVGDGASALGMGKAPEEQAKQQPLL